MKTINKEKVIQIVKESALIALSFIIPFVVLIVLNEVNNLSLFGYTKNTMMMIDMSSEYIAYMSDFRNLLLGNGNFIYTTRKVFGGDFLSIYTLVSCYQSHWVLEVLKIPNPTFNEPFRLPNAITARYWASNHPLNIHSFHLIVPGTGLGAERAAVSI